MKQQQMCCDGLLTYPCEIYPAFAQNNVPIVFTSSDYYLPFCAVAIESLLEHADANRNYDILILNMGLSEIKRAYLCEMLCNKSNVSLRFLDLSDLFEQKNFFVYAHVSKETYFRLCLPFLFTRYDTMLFLDSDIIVEGDISSLIEIKLDRFYLAAVPDIVMAGFCNGYSAEFTDYVKNTLKIKDPFSYFNAGVIVFNCHEMRKDFSMNELMEFALSHDFLLFDQDILNIKCEGKVKLLGLEWNFSPDCKIRQGAQSVQKMDYILCAPEKMRAAYEDARSRFMIIHYTDRSKPWFDPFEDLATNFWSVAQRTPFYETILFRLYEKQAEDALNALPATATTVQYYPQGKLFKRTIKRFVRIFLPYGTKRRTFVKKYYFKLRGWPV